MNKSKIIYTLGALPILSGDDPISQREFRGWKLSAPRSFWNAVNAGIIDELTNGCGTEGLCDILVPDHFYFLNISPACVVHDWCFLVWNDKAGFDLANKLFKNNLVRITKQNFKQHSDNHWNRFWKRRRLNLAKVYYKGVDELGESSYYDSHIEVYKEFSTG